MTPPRPARVATLNLFHFAEPGIGWFRPDATHDEASWEAKRAWLRDILDEMDADAVAFQEVVSVDALRALCADAGYPHFAVVEEPEIEGDAGARFYTRAVNAVATKASAKVLDVAPRDGVASALGLRDSRHFRRQPVLVEVALPGLGPSLVYSAHLKSPGASPGDTTLHHTDPPAAPVEPARAHLEGLSRSHGFATIQRVFEASALYHDAAERLSTAPNRPVFVMGDLNDDPESPTLRALTAFRAFEQAGDAEADDDAPDADEPAETFRLVDAWRLTPKSLRTDSRTATYRSSAEGRVIDFVLVSGAIASGRAGRVVSAQVFGRHFIGLPPAIASDHAAVRVEIAAPAPDVA